MSDFAFALLAGLTALILQQSFRLDFWGIPVEAGFLMVLKVYISFHYSFLSGLLSVVFLSVIGEQMSFVAPGSLIVPHLIVFVLIQAMTDQIMTEAYLTKAVWVFVFAGLGFFLNQLVIQSSFPLHENGLFWPALLMNALFGALLSLPAFIVLDFCRERWLSRFSSRRGSVTGAELYQVRSSQRKYLA